MSDGSTDTLRLVLEAASVGGTLLAVFVALNIKATVNAIKLEQAISKAELVKNQTEVKDELSDSQSRMKDDLFRGQIKMKEELTAASNKINMDLNQHNAALRLELGVHTTLDEQRFLSVERAMDNNSDTIKEQSRVLGKQSEILRDIDRKLDRNHDNKESKQ